MAYLATKALFQTFHPDFNSYSVNSVRGQQCGPHQCLIAKMGGVRERYGAPPCLEKGNNCFLYTCCGQVVIHRHCQSVLGSMSPFKMVSYQTGYFSLGRAAISQGD